MLLNQEEETAKLCRLSANCSPQWSIKWREILETPLSINEMHVNSATGFPATVQPGLTEGSLWKKK